MIALKPSILIKFALVINLLLLCLLIYNNTPWSSRVLQQRHEESLPFNNFTDPALAYEILTQLDIPKPYDNGWDPLKAAKKYQAAFLGLTSDYKYCEKHRTHYVNNPEYIFSEINFMTSWLNMIRLDVLRVIGNDIMPMTSSYAPPVPPTSPMAIDISPEVNLIVTWSQMYSRRQIQTQYGCLAQMTDHVPGLESIKAKGNLTESLYKYEENYKTRPQCFDSSKFFPKTYSLTKPEQCKEFFEIFNGEEYQNLKAEKKIVYFRKIGAIAHAATGVFPVDEKEENKIRERYQNGSLCGKIKDNNLMQSYIHNPLLLNGRKFDFRIFMLIASVNPLIVYYHDGLLRVSLSDYNPNNSSRVSWMPNANENDRIIDIAHMNGEHEGKTASQIKEEYMWSLERLRDYLMENGYINDPDWLDNYLRPKFKKAMVHLMRMAGDDFLKISSVYELHGLDFILDEDLNLWFIETNPGPAIEEATPHSRELFKKMFLSQYEIVIGLLRSRMKRVNQYVNNIIKRKEADWDEDGKIVVIKDLKEKLKEFEEITRNYFEPEFGPSKENSFEKIIDENEGGIKRYTGLIAEECL